jgi:hypothetical protein
MLPYRAARRIKQRIPVTEVTRCEISRRRMIRAASGTAFRAPTEDRKSQRGNQKLPWTYNPYTNMHLHSASQERRSFLVSLVMRRCEPRRHSRKCFNKRALLSSCRVVPDGGAASGRNTRFAIESYLGLKILTPTCTCISFSKSVELSLLAS